MGSRREIIYQQAANLFRKKGYNATSMQDIADAVGIKPSSIYNHVPSKQAILSGLLIGIADLFVQGMGEIKDSSLNPVEKLEYLISLHVRLTIEHTDAIGLIVGEWIHLEDKSKYLKMRDSYEDAFKKIINQGKRKGVIKNLDTEILLFSILSTLRWLYSWYTKNRKYNKIELENQLKEALVGGVLIV